MIPSALEGIVDGTSSNTLTFHFDAAGLSSGTILTDKMWIYHNAPLQESPIEVLFTLSVNTVEIIIDNDTTINNMVNFVAVPNPADLSEDREVVLLYSAKTGISEARLIIYDALGNTIDESNEISNKYLWNLRNKSGRRVSGGTYLVVLRLIDCNGSRIVKKQAIRVIGR